jgi:hypothetical protein
MGTRWFGARSGAKQAFLSRQADRIPEEPKAVLLHDAIASWRAWLTSGVRPVLIDSRRARGADAHLKKILMGSPSGAVDFPSAMARQAIDEAMNELPTQHRQVVKLAYFGGLTNRQIAQQLGLTVGGVRRRLSESLATVSDYVDRGRATGRRAVHGFVVWLSWRRFDDRAQRLQLPAADQLLQAGIVAVMTVAATALLMTHHGPPAKVSHPRTPPRVAAVGSVLSSLPQVIFTTPAVSAPVAQTTVADVATSAVPAAPLPINVQLPALPVTLPPIAVPPAVRSLVRHTPIV